MPDYLILGSGFTGSRVAARLRKRGLPVVEIRRDQIDFTAAHAVERLAQLAPAGVTVLHSIPTLPHEADSRLLLALRGLASRVVYLSTTGVYGDARQVDEHTCVCPQTHRALARLETENAVRAGPWESLVLRPAAIYGPGRGVHLAMLEGRYRLLGDGSNFISPIHVDDLAAIVEAGLLSSVNGTFPVADAQPCSSAEIAEYCSKLLDVPMPEPGTFEDVPESRRANRKVDGSAILRLLRTELQYPSYREGIPAAIRADQVK